MKRYYERYLFIVRRDGGYWYWWQHNLFLQKLNEEHKHRVHMEELNAQLNGLPPPNSGFIH